MLVLRNEFEKIRWPRASSRSYLFSFFLSLAAGFCAPFTVPYQHIRNFRRVGVIQSLLATCKLQGVNPHTYLVDVLQRISEHPASRVEELTPRAWKTKFAHAPMKSDLADAEQ